MKASDVCKITNNAFEKYVSSTGVYLASLICRKNFISDTVVFDVIQYLKFSTPYVIHHVIFVHFGFKITVILQVITVSNNIIF